MQKPPTAFVVLLSLLSFSPPAAPAEEEGRPDLEALHALIAPSAEEQAWMQVPWLSDLWQARRRASEEGKPIFLWEMDGHPLGCT